MDGEKSNNINIDIFYLDSLLISIMFKKDVKMWIRMVMNGRVRYNSFCVYGCDYLKNPTECSSSLSTIFFIKQGCAFMIIFEADLCLSCWNRNPLRQRKTSACS
jgi:hypothetical protein